MNDGPQLTESNHTTPDQPHSSSHFFTGPNGLRSFWCLILYVLILTIPTAVLATLADTMRAHAAAAGEKQLELTPLNSILMEWVEFGIVFFATWIMSRIEDRSVFDYGLARTTRRGRSLIVGALWGILWLSVLVGILVSTGHLVITGVLLTPLQGLRYGAEWAVMFIGVAFFEEFFFRGYLQFTLARTFAGAVKWIAPSNRYARPIGFWAAALVISFGFGFAHRSNPGESPIGMLCAGAAGLMFVLVLWRTGSLWWAIGLHAAWDWGQSFLYGVADSGGISVHHLLSSHPAGSPLLSGGLTGPEGSVFVLPVMLCITLVIVFTLPKRPTPFDAEPEVESKEMVPAAVNSAHG
ncbi:MAG TPA: CPBP family intramembrane glutamic endopeptidase [Candidatus Aquilonibacter sp.]|nr:CPBP family intramembrane glutamic endopeptidase [Candidatus Aquilonibacter sp.]